MSSPGTGPKISKFPVEFSPRETKADEGEKRVREEEIEKERREGKTGKKKGEKKGERENVGSSKSPTFRTGHDENLRTLK